MRACPRSILLLLLGGALLAAGCSSSNGLIHGAIILTKTTDAQGSRFTATAGWIPGYFGFTQSIYTEPVGTCYEIPAVVFPTGPNQYLDAGPFLLLGIPGPSILEMDSTPGTPNQYALSGTASIFTPAAYYTVASAGSSQVGAFNLPLIAPGDLIVSQPDLSAPVTVSATSNMGLVWESIDGNSPLVVTIIQTTPTKTVREVACTFQDTGTAVIPATAFAPLLLSASNPDVTTEIDISKNTYVTFQVLGPGETAGVVSSVWSGTLTVE